jgi:hypothetical protein
MIAFIDQHWDAFLLVTFVGHLLPFSWLYWRKRTNRYLRVCGIFVALIAHRGLRLASFNVDLGVFDLQTLCRVAALGLLGITLWFWVRARWFTEGSRVG